MLKINKEEEEEEEEAENATFKCLLSTRGREARLQESTFCIEAEKWGVDYQSYGT